MCDDYIQSDTDRREPPARLSQPINWSYLALFDGAACARVYTTRADVHAARRTRNRMASSARRTSITRACVIKLFPARESERRCSVRV